MYEGQVRNFLDQFISRWPLVQFTFSPVHLDVVFISTLLRARIGLFAEPKGRELRKDISAKSLRNGKAAAVERNHYLH